MIPIGTEKQLESAILKQKSLTHELCIRKILKELLDREPTIEDAKLCGQEIISDDTYRLFYKGIELGRVKIIDKPDQYRIEFTPIQKQN